MNKLTATPISFKTVEEKLDKVCARINSPESYQYRQHVLLSLLMKHVANGIHTSTNDALREHELNPVSFAALMMLFGQERETINPSELAQATGESRANVTRICDELVSKGLLKRAANLDDRRRIDLQLAATGEECVLQLLPVLRQRVHSVFDVLNEQERKTLENLLKRVLNEL
jgi:MarR family transcriptional repressor of emrRAB